MESSHSKNLIGHINFFFTPKPNPIPKLYTFVYIFYSNTLTLLHIQTGLKTQEACLKTHKRESRKYKIQHVGQSPRMTRKPSIAEGTFLTILVRCPEPDHEVPSPSCHQLISKHD
jgi:hypothetical protein